MRGAGRPIWLVGGLVAVLGAGALAHTPPLRPLLRWIGVLAGCPVSLAAGSADALEAHRVRIARRSAGQNSAAGRPALGFQLGVSTRRAVDRYVHARWASCQESSGAAILRCKIEGPRGWQLDTHFQFDSAERLVAVDVWHAAQVAGPAVATLAALEAELTESVGPATDAAGEVTEAALRGRFARVARRFEYADYIARISAIHLGERGIRVRERYQWVPPAGPSRAPATAGRPPTGAPPHG